MSCILVSELEELSYGIERQEFRVITKVEVIDHYNNWEISVWDNNWVKLGTLEDGERALALVRYLLTKNEVVSVPFDMTKLDKFIKEENK